MGERDRYSARQNRSFHNVFELAVPDPDSHPRRATFMSKEGSCDTPLSGTGPGRTLLE